MLKKLRIRLIAVTMAIVFVLLCVIFGMVVQFTKQNLERESVSMLRTVASDPQRLNWPGTSSRLPYFTVRISLFGGVRVNGTSYYDLTDTELLADIVRDALDSGQVTGLLRDYSLRYYRVNYGGGEYIVFADVSSEGSTLRALERNCLFIGLGSLTVFFLMSLLLARWATRPAERAWKQQTEFVSDASHELKTPLTVILTNAEQLRSPDYSPEDKTRFSENISVMAERMRRLVESLLSLARADNGVVSDTFSDVELSVLLEETVLTMEPVLFERGLALETEIAPDVRVRGSDMALRQVTDILLDNARKYSAPGTVRLTLERQGRNRALFTVFTPGEPLSEEERKAIFRRFYRTDKARSGDGSYGLGLAIAEGIVTAHRGKIWCESGDGGNAFLVSLPLLSSPQPTEQHTPAS